MDLCSTEVKNKFMKRPEYVKKEQESKLKLPIIAQRTNFTSYVNYDFDKNVIATLYA